ncbi:bifunctional diguanylate cyclase/phosphodiesterase [Actinoplanes sp. TBRC 11911]|uniref:putative bifunctional diguanylate cyclase/phosphodiesterase n=1 Tax=Actinoplanes sp. TBRC 11911 TaxID=2729386 RepID=UPI00145F5CDE|nr:bifunctional diguanylate cyclase/phosphodiesterase [Actinoplanes sp. TBRC 11911]NMO55537.1 bifunctional diguanylate cyclase/phosphodiesterase [Actinoplanes sp. TBRC 11911]
MGLWLIWLVLGTCAAFTYPLLPSWGFAILIGGIIGLISCVVMVLGLRRHRPADMSAWLLIASGLFLWVGGDVVFIAEGLLRETQVYPTYADFVYLTAMPVLALGLFRMSRDRWPRLSARFTDWAIIAVSLAIVYWVFVIGPVATDASLPLSTRLVTTGYPTTGVVLFAVVLPMVVRPGRQTVSRWLLIVGSVFTLICNVLYTLVPAAAAYTMWVGVGYLLAYVCWSTAVLHPSVRMPAAEPVAETFSRGRLLMLSVSMLLVPGVLLIRRTHSVDHLSWLVIGLGSAILFVLILLRLSGFVSAAQSLALHDDLTSLPNRRNFEQRVTAALGAGGSPQVAILNLADFKNINDRLGRAAADRALVAIADRLREATAEPMLVARIGGDEFALLIPDASAAESEVLARQVADALRRPIDTAGLELLLNVRVGISDGDGVSDAGELLRRADTALDAAKRHGSRFRRYVVELDEIAARDAQMGADLRRALDANEQFFLVYQPIVSLPDGRTVAVEALVRWEHPVRGLVGPVEFIPIAERNGLIVELGAWIMRTSCRQAQIWRDELGADAPQYVSVNVSAHQLAQPDFAEFVSSVLKSTGLPGEHLLVEVTETAIFSGGIAVRTLEKLRALGVRIALDDFGTGHSSLGLLQNVPVDVLKVDKSFVDNITMAGRHAVIAEALIKVADGLGLGAVAEGVETAEQAAELHRLGYRLAQGYHFGKPVVSPFREAAGVG